MSKNDFQSLVTKVMSDDGFAANLALNPEQALKGVGIQATSEMLDALKGVDVASIKKLASTFKEGQAAAA